jgi:hypothetical protein
MTIPTICVRAEEAYELVDLLTLIADVCESDASSIDEALGYFLGVGGYGTSDLRTDVLRLADELAKALGFTDSHMEQTL